MRNTLGWHWLTNLNGSHRPIILIININSRELYFYQLYPRRPDLCKTSEAEMFGYRSVCHSLTWVPPLTNSISKPAFLSPCAWCDGLWCEDDDDDPLWRESLEVTSLTELTISVVSCICVGNISIVYYVNDGRYWGHLGLLTTPHTQIIKQGKWCSSRYHLTPPSPTTGMISIRQLHHTRRDLGVLRSVKDCCILVVSGVNLIRKFKIEEIDGGKFVRCVLTKLKEN